MYLSLTRGNCCRANSFGGLRNDALIFPVSSVTVLGFMYLRSFGYLVYFFSNQLFSFS